MRLNAESETITEFDTNEITVFLLGETNLELELNRSPDEIDFIDVEYNEVDELYATVDEPQLHTAKF